MRKKHLIVYVRPDSGTDRECDANSRPESLSQTPSPKESPDELEFQIWLSQQGEVI